MGATDSSRGSEGARMGRGSTIMGSLRVVAARRRTGPNYICSNQDAWRGACGRRRPAARGIGGSEA